MTHGGNGHVLTAMPKCAAGMYSCPQQAAFGKCGAAFMVQGLFCQRTCGTCAPCKSCADCYDVVPPGSPLNCQQQVTSYSHQRCSWQEILEQSLLRATDSMMLPWMQHAYGKCSNDWMQGFCKLTCENCTCSD